MLLNKLSNKLLNLLLNLHSLCRSTEPFILDTCSATSYDTFSFNQSENGIPNDVIFCSLLLLGCRNSIFWLVGCSRGIPHHSEHPSWRLNIDEAAEAGRLVAAHVASVKGLSSKLPNLCPSPFTLRHKFGNLLLNLFGNMWPVWKHYNVTIL